MEGRYHTLDAVRGIAAIVVMSGHAVILLHPMRLPHVWLAVDLFFVLSGFVLSRVYEPRFERGMTARSFMAQRYIRLYPLFAIGMGLGILSATLALLFHGGTLSPAALGTAAMAGLLMLPSPTWAHAAEIMPLDMPGWSLFFELAVNLVYAAGWRRFRHSMPIVLCLLSGAALVTIHLRGGGFGGSDWPTFWWGFPRVGYSFFAGVLIGRRSHARSIRTDRAWAVALLLVPAFYVAFADQSLFDLLFALVASPALVAVCATLEPRHGARLMGGLGLLSYPVYVIHVPILSLAFRISRVIDPRLAVGPPWSGILVCAAIVLAATLLDRFYDRPVRRWLAGRLDGRRAQRLTDAATPL